MIDVPLANLHAQYLSIRDEIDAAIASVVRESAFVRGPHVEAFEAAFAEATESGHCISCGNGTDALYIAMHALGVRPGDEVVTTAHSWISTSETITQAGGTVVFCDTDRDTFTIDPAQIEAKVTPRTVGIVPVHLYGQPADMDAIMAIAGRHGLWVVEDCAQAHLARYKGRQVGTFGEAATYSFYPSKNLGAMGDAGAITTRDSDLARRMASFARHGGTTKNDHQIEGINSRMDGLQAAILLAKLRHLPEWTEARRRIAAYYDRHLSGLADIETPTVGAGREHVYHLYVIRSERRDDLAAAFKTAGVQTAVNYPRALPFLQAYARLGCRPEDFPNAAFNQSRILSLPLYPELTREQLAKVVETASQFRALEPVR